MRTQVVDITAFSYWSIGYQARIPFTLTIERVFGRDRSLRIYELTLFHQYDALTQPLDAVYLDMCRGKEFENCLQRLFRCLVMVTTSVTYKI